MEKLRKLGKSAAEQTLGRSLWLTTRAVRFHLDDPNGFSTIARDALHGEGVFTDNPRSLYVYMNHPSSLDPVLATRVADRYLTDLDHTYGIAGLKHYDPQRPESGLITRTATDLVEGYTGLTKILVIQPGDMSAYPEPTKSTNNLSARAFNVEALKKTRDVMQTPGNLLFAAIEGTRHKDGVLQEPPLEIHGPLKSSGEIGLAMPLAIVLPESGHIRPFMDNVRIVLGSPFSFADLQKVVENNPETTPTEIMMRRLAKLLPEQYRGVYK